jgi:hypothetical protein
VQVVLLGERDVREACVGHAGHLRCVEGVAAVAEVQDVPLGEAGPVCLPLVGEFELSMADSRGLRGGGGVSGEVEQFAECIGN